MDTVAAARAWVEGWSRAWPAGDADAVDALYAERARFRSHPFREPQPPGDYAAWAFADEDEQLVDLSFGEPIVSGDRAAVEWWAVVRRRSGGEATLAGCSAIRFRADGLVVDQRDYWAIAEDRYPPNF